ncbi:PIG-L deacetylase family protein [Flexivirga oryzae]|uniref:LmbE family N-acetylglucosaminyl deacetylase n=1 Tax=Flexivirga oryzae TaxID=1794944 RepID=A0A839N4B0_9MICO|nr:PIG-L family deacetylase [Flexivirga oryzae]MBB2892600.1 LmbE family N-acetylglucosaminyl deacetylase [Flexivirga oryzae]
MPHTLVAFHAHPDDEALLTAGTLAKAAAAGHRVVLVVATDGALGLTSDDFRDDLGSRRLHELQLSAAAMGVARVIHLGYADSGMVGDVPPDLPGRRRFVRATAASRLLADILREEGADVLMTYDAAGGYGHRDHVMVHRVGAEAARLAGTQRVVEATVPRELLARTVRLISRFYRFPSDFDIGVYERAFTPRAQITHRIDVRHQIDAKRIAMAAHASQAAADDGADRTLALFLKIPRPIYDVVFGREWFRDPAHTGPVSDDIFTGLA